MPGQVYIIRMGETDYYKVGKSTDVNDRVKALQTANPIDLHILGLYDQENPLAVESSIHIALSDLHVRGDWFKGDRETIMKVFTDYNIMATIDTAIDESTDESVLVQGIENAPNQAMRTGTVRYGTSGTNGVGKRNTGGTLPLPKDTDLPNDPISITIRQMLDSGSSRNDIVSMLGGSTKTAYKRIWFALGEKNEGELV